MATSYDDGTKTGPRRIETRDDARPSMAAPFLGLGGLALVIGSFMAWIDAGDATTGTTEIGGSSLSDGRIVMGIGFALLLMALYMGITRRRGHWFDSDLLGASLAAIATTVIVATWLTIPDGQSPEAGLYVSLAGAIVGLVGTVIALARSRQYGPGSYDVDVETTRRAA
jgi:hypothetical protein